ncbi:MAG: GntR family transcriptional regulator [Comamonas sp.]
MMDKQAQNAAGAAAPVAEVAEHIAHALEEDIVLGSLHPCQRLIEDELMARFSAKRHAVRDALALLERMGLVERKRNVGALVRHFSAQEVVELYEMRILLETQAARRMPLPAPPPAVQQLRELQQAHDAAVQANDVRGVFRSNKAFHEAFFGLCGSAVLVQAIGEYARRTHAIRFGAMTSPAQRERSRAEHHALIDALQAGARAQLVALCRAHLLPSRDAYLLAHGHAIARDAADTADSEETGADFGGRGQTLA